MHIFPYIPIHHELTSMKAEVLYSEQQLQLTCLLLLYPKIISQWFLSKGTYVIIYIKDDGYKRSVSYIFKLYKQAHMIQVHTVR